MNTDFLTFENGKYSTFGYFPNLTSNPDAYRVKSRKCSLHILAYYLPYVETSTYDTYPRSTDVWYRGARIYTLKLVQSIRKISEYVSDKNVIAADKTKRAVKKRFWHEQFL